MTGGNSENRLDKIFDRCTRTYRHGNSEQRMKSQLSERQKCHVLYCSMQGHGVRAKQAIGEHMSRFTEAEREAQKKQIQELYERYYMKPVLMKPVLRVIQEREQAKRPDCKEVKI